MSGRNVDFGDRLATAAAAKQALLEKAKAKANDPELLKKQAERAAIAAAREARENERREAKRAEEARIAAERLAKAACRLSGGLSGRRVGLVANGSFGSTQTHSPPALPQARAD